jgi:WD40 repeat protein
MGGEVHLWDLSTSGIKGTTLGKFTSKINRLDFSPDGRFLAAECDGNLMVWDLKQSPPTQTNLSIAPQEGTIIGLHFSGADDRLVIATTSTFILFRTTDWTRETSFSFSSSPSSDPFDGVKDFAISPDGKVLAVATKYQLQIISLPSGNLLASPVRKFDEEIMALAFSPDGKLLASGGADKTVTLWDASSLKMISQMGKYDFPVWSLAFSQDGKYLANLGPVNEIYLWQLSLNVWQQAACAIVNRDLSQTEWKYYLAGLTYQTTCSK